MIQQTGDFSVAVEDYRDLVCHEKRSCLRSREPSGGYVAMSSRPMLLISAS